jgi:hypothetical protein
MVLFLDQYTKFPGLLNGGGGGWGWTSFFGGWGHKHFLQIVVFKYAYLKIKFSNVPVPSVINIA